jgi:hypothetical protein
LDIEWSPAIEPLRRRKRASKIAGDDEGERAKAEHAGGIHFDDGLTLRSSPTRTCKVRG